MGRLSDLLAKLRLRRRREENEEKRQDLERWEDEGGSAGPRAEQ